mgnify:CR=1 FL=1
MVFMKFSFFTLLFVCSAIPAFMQTPAQGPRVLVVTAHPDDESAMAVTIYKVTKELGGVVDQAVITNGEGGYKYATLAEPIYNLKLTDEKVGREHLPRIRKQELINAGRILGIRNHYFFDQKDAHYGLDEREPLDTTWNVSWIETRLKEIMNSNHYDYVLCAMPDSTTHAHHKAATILALRTVSRLSEKPIIMAVTVSSKSDTVQRKFVQLRNHPVTRISSGKPTFMVDRTARFGFNDKLNYKIVVNWEIAEHKSQGTMQTFMGLGDVENFWLFDLNAAGAKQKAEPFFEALNLARPNK